MQYDHPLIVWQRHWPDVRFAKCPSVPVLSDISVHYGCKQKAPKHDTIKGFPWNWYLKGKLNIGYLCTLLPDKLSAEDRSFDKEPLGKSEVPLPWSFATRQWPIGAGHCPWGGQYWLKYNRNCTSLVVTHERTDGRKESQTIIMDTVLSCISH